MIGLATGTRIWIVVGVTDMRRGFVGLSGMGTDGAGRRIPFRGRSLFFVGDAATC